MSAELKTHGTRSFRGSVNAAFDGQKHLELLVEKPLGADRWAQSRDGKSTNTNERYAGDCGTGGTPERRDWRGPPSARISA
eukprot:gene1637-8247_t